MTTAAGSVLKIKDLTMQFGGLKAVSNLSFEIPHGSIFGLIGPNGAGKTTVFNMVTGVYTPTSGEIEAFGEDVTGLKPYKITQKGLARTFQNIRLFKDLSILDNLKIAMDHNPKRPHFGIFSSVVQAPAFVQNEGDEDEACLEILKVLKLRASPDELARNLPYGDQRRLEIGRAMATGAKLLLLDEPAAGLNPQETSELMHTIRHIREAFGMTILLIEHDMKLVMGICERIAVLDYGQKIAEGTPQQIQRDPKVIEAYLGKGASDVH